MGFVWKQMFRSCVMLFDHVFFVQMGCSYVFFVKTTWKYRELRPLEEILNLKMNMLRFNGSFQMGLI